MISNEVYLLKKENEKQEKELKIDDLNVIKDIMKGMSVFKVNSYDSQVIKRDLIGMAHEMKLRDSTINDAIGEDVKGFTREIINNTSGPSKIEICLNFFSKLSGYFFVWFVGLAIGAYGGLYWEANPILYLYYVLIVLLIFIMEGLVTPLFSNEKGVKKNLTSLISLLLFIFFTTIVYFFNDKQHTQEVNGAYIIVASGVIYLLTKYLNIKNINRLARGKNNYIEDLKNK